MLVTENHGGYTAGRCSVCSSCGWLAEYPFGVPHHSDKNALHHTKSCAVGVRLNKDGEWRPHGN